MKLEGSGLWITGRRVMGPELLLSGVKTLRKPRFPKCGRDAEKCGKISEDRRDVASTYVLRPRLGIKCPEFRMVRKKNLE